MKEGFVVIVVMLSYMALVGAVVFITAYLLRKSTRKKVALSKRMAIAFSYGFWALMLAGWVIVAGDMWSLDDWSGVLAACLMALVSASVYLWFWQRHDTSTPPQML